MISRATFHSILAIGGSGKDKPPAAPKKDSTKPKKK